MDLYDKILLDKMIFILIFVNVCFFGLNRSIKFNYAAENQVLLAKLLLANPTTSAGVQLFSDT